MDPNQSAPAAPAAVDSANTAAEAQSPAIELNLPEANQQPPAQLEIPGTEPQPSPEQLAQKRVADAQAWAHRQREETLRAQQALQQVLNDPRVAQALQQQQYEAPVAQQADNEIATLLADYKASKTEEEAFSKLLHASKLMANRDAEAMLAQREEAQYFQAQKQQAAGAVNQIVNQTAPDIPTEMFWSVSQQVEPYTPQHLVNPQERIAWQTQATIARCRQILAPHIARTAASLVSQVQAKQGMRGVMPPGSPRPTPQSGVADQPQTMADQLLARQYGTQR